MRTKSFLIFIFCVFATTVVLIVFGSQQPNSIQNIVSSTHKQIRNFQDNLKDAEQKNLVADEKYLKRLGFINSPRTYPNATWHNSSLPVITTYVLNGQYSQVIGFISNISHVFTNHTILVYDLGLSSYGLQMLLNCCNSNRCQVITFDLNSFPSHIEEDKLHAYRPLIIQDALDRTGAIMFVENNQRIIKRTNGAKLLKLYDRSLRGSGFFAWPKKNAISSLTHPKMFDYFHTKPELFYFVQMVELKYLIIINKPYVHKEIMLPWIQCTLTIDCILPIGAQSGGCRFDKKPQYRYSGCHNYDESALSVVLSLKNEFNETAYMLKNVEPLFTQVSLQTAEEELVRLDRNSTSEGSVAFSVM